MSYNYLGREIDPSDIEFISPEYGKNENGTITVYWEHSDIVDDYGFDKTNVEGDGNYINDVEIHKGTTLCRYGNGNGKMSTLVGTAYENLGLPYKKETVEYHEYEVVADGVTVRCIVTRGKAAKMFDSPGGAIQFLHKRSINEEVETGRLKEVYGWLKKKI